LLRSYQLSEEHTILHKETGMNNPQSTGVLAAALTQTLAARATALKFDDLQSDIRTLAIQCVLDWIAVAVAGSQEPLVQILRDELSEQGGHPQATVLGANSRMPVTAAALINGAASHALDFDDVNLSMSGHPTVAVLPAVLALAELRNATGAEFLTAFIAGYETECAIGAHLGSSHYARGFHSTATIGSFGSAAACANLLQLDIVQTAYAFGIAGTQAAGLKSMFGTMCKPLHAGRAAYNGLFAARLAARGFDSRPDVLEVPQGFASTQSDGIKTIEMGSPEGSFYIRSNLFKYHASCYLTHAAIECARRLMTNHHLTASDIKQVSVIVDAGCDKVCNIAEPSTGLEAKFSLRQTVAFSLAGIDTARLDTFEESKIADPIVSALHKRVRVELVPNRPHTLTDMVLETMDGRRFTTSHDAGIPTPSIEEQGQKLIAKFRALVTPVLGTERAEEILSVTQRLATSPSVSELTRLLVNPFK
jgi:2-methylcitrate dehydratase PrpD